MEIHHGVHFIARCDGSLKVAIVYIVDDNFVPNIESQVAINNCVQSSLSQEEPKVGEGVDAKNLVNMDLENLIDVGVEDEDSEYEDFDYEQSHAGADNLFYDIVEKCANEKGNVNVSSSVVAFPNLEFGDVETESENSEEFKSADEEDFEGEENGDTYLNFPSPKLHLLHNPVKFSPQGE
ncbi:hypothetical protein ACE6H2_010011 [Prunus campanulata]